MNVRTDELAIASALAHLTRLRMLDSLRLEPHSFEGLVRDLNLAPNAVNFHLRILLSAELVEENEATFHLTNSGKEVFSVLVKNAIERLEKKEKEN